MIGYWETAKENRTVANVEKWGTADSSLPAHSGTVSYWCPENILKYRNINKHDLVDSYRKEVITVMIKQGTFGGPSGFSFVKL